MGLLEDLKLFFSGAFDFQMRAKATINMEYENELEEFYILCFSDILGIDLPTSYYALEFYPFLAAEMERWQRKSLNRKSVWDKRADDFDI